MTWVQFDAEGGITGTMQERVDDSLLPPGIAQCWCPAPVVAGRHRINPGTMAAEELPQEE